MTAMSLRNVGTLYPVCTKICETNRTCRETLPCLVINKSSPIICTWNSINLRYCVSETQFFTYRRRIGQLTSSIGDTMSSSYNVHRIHNRSAAEVCSCTILNRNLSGEFTQIGWCSVNDTRQELHGSIDIVSRQRQLWQFCILLLCYRRRRQHCAS